MTQPMPAELAIIYIPRERQLDTAFKRLCELTYRRHGYGSVVIVRDWETVEHFLAGGVDTVVMVPGEYHAADHPAAKPDLYDTQELGRVARKALANQRSATHARSRREALGRRGALMAQVHDVVDNGADPPTGWDAETIAAARRIAAHITVCNQPRVY